MLLIKCPIKRTLFIKGHQMDTSSYIKTDIKGIKVHKSNKSYLLDFRIERKRYRKQIPAMPIKEAIQSLTDFKASIIKQSTIQVDINSTVNDYWELLRQVKQWTPAHDKKINLYYIRNIKNPLGSLKVTDVKPKHLTRFNTTLTHLSNRSQKTAYEILKPLFELAIEDELIDTSPIKKVHMPKRNQLEEKKIITDANVKYRYLYQSLHTVFGTDQYIEKCEYQCTKNPHHLALFLFGFHCRRLNEVLSLNWEDINFITDTYIVRSENSKVSLDMEFKLPQDVRQALIEMDSRTSKGKVFASKTVQRYYSTIRKVSGIPEFTFHWMRNLSVSALASQGVDVTHLSAMLGHNDAGTLKKYLSLQRTASTNVTNDVTAKLLAWDEEG